MRESVHPSGIPEGKKKCSRNKLKRPSRTKMDYVLITKIINV